jgi:hypothetical protein
MLSAAALTGSHAASAQDKVPRAFETQTLVGSGGPVGLSIMPTQEPPTSKPFTFHIAQRFRSPGYSGLGMELSVVLPCGAGANILFDAYHTERFRLHLLDPGVFYNTNNSAMNHSQVSVDRLARRWDMTFGLGADILVREDDGVWLTGDVRVFMPDPILLSDSFGGLARPYVDEALKGGNLWLGLAFTW